MTDSDDPTIRQAPVGGDPLIPEEPDRRIPIAAMVGAGIALVVALVALLLVLDDDDTVETVDPSSTTSSSTTTSVDTTTSIEETTTTTTVESTTTTAESTTSTTSTPSIDPEAYRPAVWPWPDAATGAAAARFDDPVDAATSFAVDFVGFVDPTVGEFQAGDSRSGEVEVRPSADGPITTVFVRQLASDDTWWAIGAATEDIVISRPDALEVLEDELVVEGEARVFEGNVEVVLRADGLSDPIFEGNVTGRGDGEFGAFDETFSFDAGAAESGAALFIARSAEDGNVSQVGVVRVYFSE